MNVRIISDGTPHGTRVTTAEGQEIEGLTSVTFRAQVNDINRAELELYAGEVDAIAGATVYVRGKEVRRIEYADGTVDEFPA